MGARKTVVSLDIEQQSSSLKLLGPVQHRLDIHMCRIAHVYFLGLAISYSVETEEHAPSRTQYPSKLVQYRVHKRIGNVLQHLSRVQQADALRLYRHVGDGSRNELVRRVFEVAPAKAIMCSDRSTPRTRS